MFRCYTTVATSCGLFQRRSNIHLFSSKLWQKINSEVKYTLLGLELWIIKCFFHTRGHSPTTWTQIWPPTPSNCGHFTYYIYILCSRDQVLTIYPRVSVQGVKSLWGLFWQIGGHSSRFVLFCSFWRVFTVKMIKV